MPIPAAPNASGSLIVTSGEATVGRDAHPPARMGSQHTVVEHEIHPGGRPRGGQLLEEFQPLEEQMPRAIRPDRLVDFKRRRCS